MHLSRFHRLHYIEARTPFFKLGILPNLDIERAKLPQVINRKLMCTDCNKGASTLTKARDHQANILVVMLQTTGHSIAAVRVPTVGRQEHRALFVLLMERDF